MPSVPSLAALQRTQYPTAAAEHWTTEAAAKSLWLPAGFFGFLLDRTHAFKIIMGVSQTVVLVCAIALCTKYGDALHIPRVQGCLVCMGIMGFLIIPTALEMSAEVAFPYSAQLSSGVLWIGAHLTSAIVGLLVDSTMVVQGDLTPRFEHGRWLLLACFAIAAVLWWLFPVRCGATWLHCAATLQH
jgi:hypothetical protein